LFGKVLFVEILKFMYSVSHQLIDPMMASYGKSMNMLSMILTAVLLYAYQNVCAQKQSREELVAEVEKWKKLAEENLVRATKAEADAKRRTTIAVQKQKEAEIAQAAA
jgi:hypothetical protein